MYFVLLDVFMDISAGLFLNSMRGYLDKLYIIYACDVHRVFTTGVIDQWGRCPVLSISSSWSLILPKVLVDRHG